MKPIAKASQELTTRVPYVRPRVQTFTADQLQSDFADVFAQSAFSDVYIDLPTP